METPDLNLPAAQVSSAGMCQPELPGARASENEMPHEEAQARQSAPQVYACRADENKTQLAAIRELMTRACDRDVWLTLAEIAEVTEFAEASISAQLRHLRKSEHGGYRVQKRRRGTRLPSAVLRRVRDGARGPVIWEYRVLAPESGQGQRG